MGLSDGEVVYRARKSKQLGLVLVCLLFVTIAVTLMNGVWAWFVGLFFAVGLVVSLVQMLPNASYLKLTPEGFEVRALFRSGFTRWEHVADIGVVGDRVALIFADDAGADRLRALVWELDRVEGILPDTYGHNADDLAEVMWQWKLEHSRPA